jgi:hypothetical protein
MTVKEAQMIVIPEGSSGDWRIERFTVSEEQAKFDAMRGAFHGGRYCPAGTYTRLMRGTGWQGMCVMSDTPDELRDLYKLYHLRGGRVLVTGLGLGCAVQMLLAKPEIEHVDVVEISKNVIDLVAWHLIAHHPGRLTIMHADAFTWMPPKGVRYTGAWHDIWDNICADNLPQMTKLKRHYGRRTDWQGCWCEYQCRRHSRGGLY